jgi:hypothetical protein
MATGYTLLRQDEDIRKSEVYDDTIAPTLAAYETNPADIEDDLNNVRSQIQNFLNRSGAGFPAANWYDDISVPSTLETGTARGINALNDGLHVVEKKRILKCVWSLDSLSIAGAGDTFDILGTGELPGNTTAAVGAVTTLGTVVAPHGGTFGTHSLAEVAGTTAISPKNLLSIVDATTRDPILDGSEKIYGLLQAESGLTDGGTITDATTTRVQISFVKISGNDLVAITSGAMDGKSYDYCYVERVRFEDLNEQDFLGDASVDVPAGSTVTRQVGYDNQGATPVNLTNNAILDIEGAGLIWQIRDDLEAPLFTITEGSAGDTTSLAIGSQVDTFDVDAVDNDFLNGATFGTTGTGIQISETQGVIERAADLEIRASGAGELYLDDSNQPVSWAQTAGVKLSDTATEWSDYETAFGGEVSLLNAIVQAYNAGANPVRTFHELQANVAKDANVGGPSTTANNVDVDFPDALLTNFLTDHWLFLNGRLMRPGADATANFDYYPGSVFTAGDVNLAFERNLKSGDIIVTVYWP